MVATVSVFNLESVENFKKKLLKFFVLKIISAEDTVKFGSHSIRSVD